MKDILNIRKLKIFKDICMHLFRWVCSLF